MFYVSAIASALRATCSLRYVCSGSTLPSPRARSLHLLCSPLPPLFCFPPPFRPPAALLFLSPPPPLPLLLLRDVTQETGAVLAESYFIVRDFTRSCRYQTPPSSSESNMPPPASAGGAPKAECTAIVSGSASGSSNPSTSRSERLENPRPCSRCRCNARRGTTEQLSAMVVHGSGVGGVHLGGRMWRRRAQMIL
jgi:hypothetical protein